VAPAPPYSGPSAAFSGPSAVTPVSRRRMRHRGSTKTGNAFPVEPSLGQRLSYDRLRWSCAKPRQQDRAALVPSASTIRLRQCDVCCLGLHSAGNGYDKYQIAALRKVSKNDLG